MRGEVQNTVYEGRACCALSCGSLQLRVDPADGLNIFSVVYNGREVVKFRRDRYEEGRTYGIPILYPTPNRTRDDRFTFNEMVHETEMHGLVKKHPFEVVSMEADDVGAVLTGRVVFEPGSILYRQFPYKSELQITIRVEAEQFTYSYRVKNRDDLPLPYGFALHPFFEKLGQDVKMRVMADSVMDAGEDKLPTGGLIPVEGTEFDLRTSVPVNERDLDHVYTGITGQPCAVAEYEDFCLELTADPVFTHLVVFTPEQEFFCLENQTCSTDAANMYNRGFKELSNLQIVEPGGEQGGSIVFRFAPG